MIDIKELGSEACKLDISTEYGKDSFIQYGIDNKENCFFIEFRHLGNQQVTWRMNIPKESMPIFALRLGLMCGLDKGIPIGNWQNTESIDVSTKEKKEELITAMNKCVEKNKEDLK